MSSEGNLVVHWRERGEETDGNCGENTPFSYWTQMRELVENFVNLSEKR